MSDIFDDALGLGKSELRPWNIGFMNRFGREDETQLDSDSSNDLRELWGGMHDEFDADFGSILYIKEGVEE